MQEKQGYIDPAKAEEARELGNKRFKEADWPGAVEAYTETTKRAPEDPRGYTNRAAAFIKLMSFPSAVQDCDEAIRQDPNFIKAYIRKAQAYFAMREYSKCLDICTEALEHDAAGQHTREIEQQQQKALQTMYSSREGETEEQTMERIQKDPEVSLCRPSRPNIPFPERGVVALTGRERPDRRHPAGPGHAEHPAASEERPGRAARPHEERHDPVACPEAHRRRRHSLGRPLELLPWGFTFSRPGRDDGPLLPPPPPPPFRLPSPRSFFWFFSSLFPPTASSSRVASTDLVFQCDAGSPCQSSCLGSQATMRFYLFISLARSLALSYRMFRLLMLLRFCLASAHFGTCFAVAHGNVGPFSSRRFRRIHR